MSEPVSQPLPQLEKKRRPTTRPTAVVIAPPTNEQRFPHSVPVPGLVSQAVPEGAQQPVATAPKAGSAKTPKPTTEERRRQFDLLTDADKRILSDQWFVAKEREALTLAAFADRKSFEFVLTLTLEQRKVLRVDHIQNTQLNTRAEFSTLTKSDKTALAKDYGMTPQQFGNLVSNDQKYQYIKALQPEEVSVLTPQEIKAQTKVSAEECTERRLRDHSKLTEKDKKDQTQSWQRLQISGKCIQAALGSEKSYTFFVNLTENQQRSADEELIAEAKAPKDWGQYRRRKFVTMQTKDWAVMSLELGMDPGDDRITAAKEDSKNFNYLRKLRPEARNVATADDVRTRTPLDNDAIRQRKANKQTEEHGQKAGRREVQKQADAAESERLRVAKLLFDQQLTADLERERIAAVAAFPLLRPTALRDIARQVRLEGGVERFAELARNAWQAQRSPTNLDTWVSWMNLTLRPVFDDLTDISIDYLQPVDGRSSNTYAAHISLDRESLREQVPVVTDIMTPAQLLDLLFVPAGNDQPIHVLHVTLDTYGRNQDNGRSLPHRYWRPTGRPRYEVRTQRNPRWNPAHHDEQQIRDALDFAYAQMLTRLRDRAQFVLTDAGRTLDPAPAPR